MPEGNTTELKIDVIPLIGVEVMKRQELNYHDASENVHQKWDVLLFYEVRNLRSMLYC